MSGSQVRALLGGTHQPPGLVFEANTTSKASPWSRIWPSALWKNPFLSLFSVERVPPGEAPCSIRWCGVATSGWR